jgi:cell shape-determining protein MreC
MDNHNENHISNTLSDYELLELRRKEKQNEIDQLKAENERLRETLKYIIDRGYIGASYVAQQALNEVTK